MAGLGSLASRIGVETVTVRERRWCRRRALRGVDVCDFRALFGLSSSLSSLFSLFLLLILSITFRCGVVTVRLRRLVVADGVKAIGGIFKPETTVDVGTVVELTTLEAVVLLLLFAVVVVVVEGGSVAPDATCSFVKVNDDRLAVIQASTYEEARFDPDDPSDAGFCDDDVAVDVFDIVALADAEFSAVFDAFGSTSARVAKSTVTPFFEFFVDVAVVVDDDDDAITVNAVGNVV